MRNRTVVLVFAVCLVAAAVWAAVIACPAPEEDACSSIGSTAVFIASIGIAAGLVVTLVVAVGLAVSRRLARRRG